MTEVGKASKTCKSLQNDVLVKKRYRLLALIGRKNYNLRNG